MASQESATMTTTSSSESSTVGGGGVGENGKILSSRFLEKASNKVRVDVFVCVCVCTSWSWGWWCWCNINDCTIRHHSIQRSTVQCYGQPNLAIDWDCWNTTWFRRALHLSLRYCFYLSLSRSDSILFHIIFILSYSFGPIDWIHSLTPYSHLLLTHIHSHI